MSEISDRYGRVADAFTARLRGVPPGSWSNPSPCAGWSAYDVARHVVDTHRRVLTRLSGGDPSPPDSDEDLAAAWAVESAAVRGALADPARAAVQVPSPAGTQPFEDLVGGVLCTDTLLHTWDLARATGQDDRLDEEAVRTAHELLTAHEARLRTPGGFGPPVDPPAGGNAQTRLVCFSGRTP